MEADLYCKLIGSQLPLWMMSITSSWNLALVNFERYLSIVYPIFHKTGITKCHTVMSITVVWLIGVAFDLPYIYFTSGYRNGTCVTTSIWPNYTVAVVVGVIGLFVQVLLPFIIMIGLYFSMMKVIRTKIANHTSVNQNSKGSRLTSRTRNILKTLAVVTFIFVVCYSPNWTLYLMYIAGHIDVLSGDFYSFTVYLVFVNCCVNPIIYSAQYKDFQMEVKKLCCKRKINNASTNSTLISRIS